MLEARRAGGFWDLELLDLEGLEGLGFRGLEV